MPPHSESSAPAASMTPGVFCKGCGYALVGLESNKCPECGRGFDLANRRTFARRPPRGWVWRWGKRLLVLTLVLLLAAGAGMGWLWWGWNAEQPTVARLRTFHQTVHVASIGPERLRWVLGERWGYLTARVEQVIVTSLPSGETEHLDFASLAQIQKLRLMRCEWSSSNLNKLAGLRKLHILGLWDLKIEKADLSFIEKLPELSTLQLRGKWVADAGFNHLAGLKHLKVLWLWETDLNDADLQEIEGLTALEYLDLRDNPISDTGLAHLQGLKALRTLWIDHRLAGSSSVTKLKQAIPGLQVRTP